MRTLPLLLLPLAAACVLGPVTVAEDELSFTDEVHRVVIDAGAGDVEVVRADVASTEVDRTMRYSGEAPTMTANVRDGVLTLRVQCRPLQRQCSVDHIVRLPDDASVVVDVGAGDVYVRDLAGKVDVDTGSGDVELVDIVGSVVATTGSGSVDGDGLVSKDVVVDTGSGDVTLDLLEAPSEVDIDTGSGDVRLDLPGGRYALSTDTGSGDVRVNGITADRASGRRLNVDTGSGDVVIKGH